MTSVHSIDLSGAPFHLDAAAESWVQETLASMTLTEKLGQMIVPMLLDDGTAEIERLAALGVGGIFLFHAPTERLRAVSEQLQRASRLPMLVAGDIEFGEMAPLDGLGFTSQLGVAATDDATWSERLGLTAARAGRRCGYNWILTPVIDIDFNPHNPVVNTRSFGSDPQRVAALGKTYIVAAQSQGVAACAKHWPGDGMDYRDQHMVTTINNMSMERWHSSFGACYREAIAAGVKTIMSAHVALPAYEGAAQGPASLTGALNHDLLRAELGFNGLIVTDATTMAGFGASGDRETLVTRAITSGCDMILFTANAEIDRIFLERACFDGRLPPERVDAAVMRVLALKASLGLHIDRSLAPVVEAEREEEQRWERDCARQSITLVRDDQQLLPLNPSVHKRILLFAPEQRMGPMGPLPPLEIAKLLEAEGFQISLFSATTVVDPALFDMALYVLAEEAAMCRRDLRIDWRALHHGTIRSMERFWNILPCAMLSLGNPYHHLDAPNCPTLVNAYSASPAAQRAAVEALTGAIAYRGVSPVDPLGGAPCAFAAFNMGEPR